MSFIYADELLSEIGKAWEDDERWSDGIPSPQVRNEVLLYAIASALNELVEKVDQLNAGVREAAEAIREAV